MKKQKQRNIICGALLKSYQASIFYNELPFSPAQGVQIISNTCILLIVVVFRPAFKLVVIL
jgi:hypothetical protein